MCIRDRVEAIQEYANITELDAATLNRLIKEIVVHERIEDVYKRQKRSRKRFWKKLQP